MSRLRRYAKPINRQRKKAIKREKVLRKIINEQDNLLNEVVDKVWDQQMPIRTYKLKDKPKGEEGSSWQDLFDGIQKVREANKDLCLANFNASPIEYIAYNINGPKITKPIFTGSTLMIPGNMIGKYMKLTVVFIKKP
jgi:hypothetical protein